MVGEWIHIGIAAFGSIVGTLVLIIFHDLRDRIVRLEQKADETAKEIARIQGRIQ